MTPTIMGQSRLPMPFQTCTPWEASRSWHLNIAALPPDLPAEITQAILMGGAEKVREAGAVLAGGHSIQDKEPKFGLVVLGFVDPQHMLTKGGARPGDSLVLTKPLGFGTLTTALKRGLAADQKMSRKP